MMKIDQVEFSENILSSESLLITAIGYERRSYHILDRCLTNVNLKNVLCFTFNDTKQPDHTRVKLEHLASMGVKFTDASYNSYTNILIRILDFINVKKSNKERLDIHVDYSSMPRSWYCRIPDAIHGVLRKNDSAFFWYSMGEYPQNYDEFPCAGINNFTYFTGKPSLSANNNRTHMLGLGLDYIRSQAITIVLDPSYIVSCYAYPATNKELRNSVRKVNDAIISRSLLSFALHIEEFPFMVSKIIETIYELNLNSDVIIIPDGPKPLILAMSMASQMTRMNGVSCLHLTRNDEQFTGTDVVPTGIVYGFSLKTDIYCD